jgi:DNA-binding response OmpR family regulator
VIRDLGNAFHQRGYDVRAARDGSRALEKTILVHPDLVLFDDNSPLLPARKFVQILRSNPRTEHIPVIIMRGQDHEDPALWGYREALIRKPFNTEEVLSLVAVIFRRMKAAKAVNVEGEQVGGQLGPVSLTDLLQIFRINNKTGTLRLDSEVAGGFMVLREGRLVHASLGAHRGEKALFRLLAWRQGQFSFLPEVSSDEVSIRRSTDLLLLESARQADEMARLRASMPADGVRLAAVPEMVAKFDGLHPVAQELLGLLEYHCTVGELIENSRVSDFEACQGIRNLLDKGVLCVREELLSRPDSDEPWLPADLMYDLMVRLAARHGSSSKPTRGKICLLCLASEMAADMKDALAALPGFDSRNLSGPVGAGFGHLGELRLSENLRLQWMLLPNQGQLQPLWAPLGVGMDAALLLGQDTGHAALERLEHLARGLRPNLRIPIIQIGPEDPKWKWPGREPAALRKIVVHLLHQMIGVSLQRPVG